jgi:hypothetical protein
MVAAKSYMQVDDPDEPKQKASGDVEAAAEEAADPKEVRPSGAERAEAARHAYALHACSPVEYPDCDNQLVLSFQMREAVANKDPKRIRRSSASRRSAAGRRDPRTTSSVFRGVTKHRCGSTRREPI